MMKPFAASLTLVVFASLTMVGGDVIKPAAQRNLIENGSLEAATDDHLSPEGFLLSGDATYGVLGDEWDRIGRGVRLVAGRDVNGDGQQAGTITATVRGLTPESGRWFRLRIQGLAHDNFVVAQDDLYLQVEFFRDDGKNELDHIKKPIYPLVEQERKALRDRGTNRTLGAAVWRSYDLEFRTPFPEVDTLRVSVGFAHGQPSADLSSFWINEIELTPMPLPADYRQPAGNRPRLGREDLTTLVPLGGRWFFDPLGGSREPPAQFDHTNAERLFYLAGRLETPFADNTAAVLRAGYKDRLGRIVETDRFVPDNVTVSFTPTHLVVRSKNLPNHPTAAFPDRWRSLDGNPNYIQEQDSTWYIPLTPRLSPQHVVMKNQNNNDHALPMGPIGVAVNGVVFFNPFDHLLDEDAVWRLDRCCGHPAPNSMYHYHKYPVCIKSPWSDDGSEHSPLIGFAFDGFPVYGPYEATGELAKDSKGNPLNEFNVHFDADRGWHYHVTPGQFPHIIGGYWGEPEAKNRGRGGPPPKGKKGGSSFGPSPKLRP